MKETAKELRVKLYTRQRKLIWRGDFLHWEVMCCFPGDLVRLNPRLLK
jgi:hypothetical protein